MSAVQQCKFFKMFKNIRFLDDNFADFPSLVQYSDAGRIFKEIFLLICESNKPIFWLETTQDWMENNILW